MSLRKPCLGTVQKGSDARRARNCTARHIRNTLSGAVLPRNPHFIGTDEHFVKPSAFPGKEGVYSQLRLPPGMRSRSTVPLLIGAFYPIASAFFGFIHGAIRT